MIDQNSQHATAAPTAWRYWLALAALAGAYWLSAALYRPWKATAPDLPMAHVRLADDLAQADRLPEAVAQCQAALALRPDDVLARFNLAVYLRQRGNNGQAETELRYLAQKAPRFAQANVLLGTILAERGDNAAAVEAWRAAGEHPAAIENLRRLKDRQKAGPGD